jgi:hypothetical protein
MSFWRNLFHKPIEAADDDVTPPRRDALIREGKLVELWLMPQILGGTRDVRNVLWAPPETAAEKAAIDEEVRSWVAGGETANYSATPAYTGRSMVPSTIHVAASTPTKRIERTITVPPTR